MSTLDSLRFANTYARLHPAFYEVVEPTPIPDPYLVAFNPDAAELLDLDPTRIDPEELTRVLAGNQRIPGSEPIAEAYAGHQFGVWVPQLGDGRAFLLGQVANHKGESWDLHLKGGGRTRFSRFGDGRSVLRSAIREYLACEALHGLGIPTTRALGIAGSDLPVQRERIETAATLIRLAPTHVRFGTFEYFASRGEVERVADLLEYVVANHFPNLAAGRQDGRTAGSSESVADSRPSALPSVEPAVSFFREVCERTARLMAKWIAVGFAHGVMNTDNMSILGLTLDYGPYGFLEGYDAGFIGNHTDEDGRYGFGRQPAAGMWNCARLGEALTVLDPRLAKEPGNADLLAPWQAALEAYWPAFNFEYLRLMREKLGLATAEDQNDAELIKELLGALQDEGADYTRFFRELCRFNPDDDRSTRPPDRRSAFSARYAARLRAEGSVDAERSARMLRTNPKYVLRNWIAQEAIERAERKEFDSIESLRTLFRDPCAEHPDRERFAQPASGAAREIVVSCSS